MQITDEMFEAPKDEVPGESVCRAANEVALTREPGDAPDISGVVWDPVTGHAWIQADTGFVVRIPHFDRDPNAPLPAELVRPAAPNLGPGFLHVMTGRENMSGCKAVGFKNADDLNAFFDANRGLLIVSISPVGDQIVVIYHRVMSDAEHRQLMRIQSKVDELLAVENEAIAAAAVKQKDIDGEKQAKEKRLLELGRTCEANHGAVIEDNQKLRKQLKKERKAEK